jgi:NADPH:quinone reductase-like Zn-dependent oxidoreductase
MKAIVNTAYGSADVLQFREVEKPSPKDNEVLVKIHAASLNAADWHFMRANPALMRLFSGLFRPKNSILGMAVAGRIEAVGKNVKRFQVGVDVLGDLFASGLGGFAEYVCAPEAAFVLKPDKLSYEDAASIPVAALTALQGLRDHGHIQAGQKVLINGAVGGVGSFAVQLAKFFGAEVSGVCSTGNLDLLRSIGADHVIDYSKEDFTKSGLSYDLIFAANGYHPIADYKRALSPGGRYVMVGGSGAQVSQAMLLGPWLSMFGSQKMGSMMAKSNPKDLLFLVDLVEAGKIKPLIDRRYPLSEVAQGIRYLEEGHARGKVIIKITSDPS